MSDVPISFRAGDDLLKSIDKLARQLGVSRAEAIRQAITVGTQVIAVGQREAGGTFKGKSQTRLMVQLLGSMFTNDEQLDLFEALVQSEKANK